MGNAILLSSPLLLKRASLCAISCALLFAAACGSSSQTVTGPSGAKCAVQAQPERTSFPPAGGSATLRIDTNRECVWAVNSQSGWLALSTPVEGQGQGSVTYTVAANADPSGRSGGLKVNDQEVQISQDGRPCEFRLSSTQEAFGAVGGDRAIRLVASSAQCAWTAAADQGWIEIVSPQQGRGSGEVAFRVGPTGGATRAGRLTIAGLEVLVEQTAAPAPGPAPGPGPGPAPGCTFAIDPTTFSFGASGGAGEVRVPAPPACVWTAESPAPWISVTGPAGGTGPGMVSFRVAATDGPARAGQVRIAGMVVTVTQTPGCTFSVEPGAYTAPVAGATGAIAVTTANGCSWSASTGSAWIAITSSTSGSGPGRVDFTVPPNAGPARSGTVTIGGQAVTVTQPSGCTATVAPAAYSAPVAGGTGALTVSTAAGCPWSAASAASWISLNGDPTGNGPGRMEFTVAANTGPERSGALTIAGRSIAVTQPSGCQYSIGPPGYEAPGAGGGATVVITTAAGCPWSATAGVPWVTLSAGAGTGPAQVQLAIAANSSPARTGSLTIAGHAFTVAQASLCTYALNPQSSAYDANGGHGAVLVLVTGPCTWTAATEAAWIQLNPAYSAGTGNGLFQFAIPGNPGAPRTGSVTVAGQVHTVTQGGR